MNNKCIYYDTCPSNSGWCLNKKPQTECIDFILTALLNERKTHYLVSERDWEETYPILLSHDLNQSVAKAFDLALNGNPSEHCVTIEVFESGELKYCFGAEKNKVLKLSQNEVYENVFNKSDDYWNV